MSQLINFLPEEVHLVNGSTVTIRDIEEHLDAMILFDEEVYLVLKLRHITLISLMLILLSQLVHVLATLVQLAQSHDFIVSDLDLLIQAPGFLFLLQVLLHEFIILLPQLVSSLICSAQFCCPLLIFDIHTTVTSHYL